MISYFQMTSWPEKVRETLRFLGSVYGSMPLRFMNASRFGKFTEPKIQIGPERPGSQILVRGSRNIFQADFQWNYK